MSHPFSTLPLLCLLLAVFWLRQSLLAKTAGRISSAEILSLLVWLLGLAVWGVVTTKLANSGFYRRPDFLALLPGFWVPMIPVGLTMAFMILPSFRAALVGVVNHQPRAFVAVQALRIGAIGGVVKGLTGLLPPAFALGVGIPDLLFGLSALWLGLAWPGRRVPPRTLVLWNVVGMVIILLPAPILFQLALPGKLQIFMGSPDARVLLDYPMVLAPTLVVPLLVTMNGILAMTVHSGLESGRTQGAGP